MADQKQTIEAPETVPEQHRFAMTGQGYEPGARLVVRLEHDSGWHRKRDVEVGADGGFNLVSFSHIPGTIGVVVETDAPKPIRLATATIKVRVATAEEVAANAKPSDSAPGAARRRDEAEEQGQDDDSDPDKN